MDIGNTAFLVLLIPLASSALVMCVKAFARGRTAAVLERAFAFAGIILPWIPMAMIFPYVSGGGVSVDIIGRWGGPTGIVYRFDSLAWLLDALCLTIAFPAYLYLSARRKPSPGLTALFLIMVFATLATAATSDIFNLFVCLEIVGLSSYVLVASSEKPEAFVASFSYLVLSSTAMLFYLFAVYGLYRLTGALSYSGIAEGLAALPDGGGTQAKLSLAFMVAAIAVRVAVLPVYGWLPDAHAMAPHGISAILSAVLIKTPLFALYRLVAIFTFASSLGELFVWAGAATAILAVLTALSQKDCKRLLAYHSVSQIGYVVAAWGAGIQAGGLTGGGLAAMSAAFLYALYHALFKSLLFLSIGTTADAAGERNVSVLRNATASLRAAGDRSGLTLLCYAIGALSIAALPPLPGFAGKAAIGHVLKGHPAYHLLTLASVCTAASFMKLSAIYMPMRPADPGTHRGFRIGAAVLVPQLLLAALCIASGIMAPLLARIVSSALSGGTPRELPPGLFSSGRLVPAIVTAAAGYAVYRAVVSRAGTRIATAIRERRRSFEGLFVALSAAVFAIVVWLTVLAP